MEWQQKKQNQLMIHRIKWFTIETRILVKTGSNACPLIPWLIALWYQQTRCELLFNVDDLYKCKTWWEQMRRCSPRVIIVFSPCGMLMRTQPVISRLRELPCQVRVDASNYRCHIYTRDKIRLCIRGTRSRLFQYHTSRKRSHISLAFFTDPMRIHPNVL